jgi:hypothetical protein
MTTYLLLSNLCRHHLYLKNTSSTAGVAVENMETSRKRAKWPFSATIASAGLISLARGMAEQVP